MAQGSDFTKPTDISIGRSQIENHSNSICDRVIDELISNKTQTICTAAEAVVSKNDLDNDSQLSFIELTNLFAKEDGENCSSFTSQIKAIQTINRLDLNGDNKLSADELVEGLRSKKETQNDILDTTGGPPLAPIIGPGKLPTWPYSITGGNELPTWPYPIPGGHELPTWPFPATGGHELPMPGPKLDPMPMPIEWPNSGNDDKISFAKTFQLDAK